MYKLPKTPKMKSYGGGRSFSTKAITLICAASTVAAAGITAGITIPVMSMMQETPTTTTPPIENPTIPPAEEPAKDLIVEVVGHNNASLGKITVKEGSKIADADLPTPPNVNGYVFKHWAVDGKQWNFDHSYIYDNLKFEANYEKIETPTVDTKFSVSFFLDGGTTTSLIPTEKVTNGNKVSQPQQTPQKLGYTFSHWALDGKQYSFNNVVTKDLVLVAIYNKNIIKYTVTFKDKNNTTLKTIQVNEETTISSGDVPTAPSVANYTFKYWMENNIPWNLTNSLVKKNIELKAHYEPNEILTVQFLLGDGTSDTPIPSFKGAKGSTITAPTITPKKANWHFTHWTDYNGTKFNFATQKLNTDIVLFAQYAIDTHIVTFQSDTGATLKTVTVDYGSTVTADQIPIVNDKSDTQVFHEWKSGTSSWSSSTPITDHITVKASFVTLTPGKPLSSNPAVLGSSWNVGNGQKWQNNLVAPFVDTSLWTASDANDSNSDGVNGVLNMSKIAKDTGVKFYHLGFITEAQKPATEGGNLYQTIWSKFDSKVEILNWGFGGFEALQEGSTSTQYTVGIKGAMQSIRDKSGDFAISMGGATGSNFYARSNSEKPDLYKNTYREIIKGYGLTRIDLDIEGEPALSVDHTDSARGIAAAQKEFTHTQVSLTFPVAPTGLLDNTLKILDTYLAAGLDISQINIMTMAYGGATTDYAQASITAIDGTKDQIKAAYAKIGQTLTDAQAYAKLGFVNSVGREGAGHPDFLVDDTRKVLVHAAINKVGLGTFWSMNRDANTDSSQAGVITTKYEYINLYKKFYNY